MPINHDQRSNLGNLSGEIVELAVGVGVGVGVSGPRWTLVDGGRGPRGPGIIYSVHCSPRSTYLFNYLV